MMESLFINDVKNGMPQSHIETSVENQQFLTANCTVQAYLTDREGNKLGKTKEQSISLNTDGKRHHETKNFNLANAKLWSVDYPYLYRVVAVVNKQQPLLMR